MTPNAPDMAVHTSTNGRRGCVCVCVCVCGCVCVCVCACVEMIGVGEAALRKVLRVWTVCEREREKEERDTDTDKHTDSVCLRRAKSCVSGLCV